ncbi:MAG: NFACT family protein, partial [Clostridiales bacterium]|nr:NFACT family protein [Clostridiales bacterium]
MPLDAATLTGVVSELRPTVEGAKIDKIFQPGRDELVLQLRSAGGGECKMHISPTPAHPPNQLPQVKRE